MATIEYVARGPDEEGLWSVFSITHKSTSFLGDTEREWKFVNWVSDHDTFEDAYAHCCYMQENYS